MVKKNQWQKINKKNYEEKSFNAKPTMLIKKVLSISISFWSKDKKWKRETLLLLGSIWPFLKMASLSSNEPLIAPNYNKKMKREKIYIHNWILWHHNFFSKSFFSEIPNFVDVKFYTFVPYNDVFEALCTVNAVTMAPVNNEFIIRLMIIHSIANSRARVRSGAKSPYLK